MTAEHRWQDCRPALLSVDDDDTTVAADAVSQAWASLDASEREAFHRCCCLNSRAPDDLIAMNRIVAMVGDLIAEGSGR